MPKHALIVGATGAVGSQLLNQLLDNDSYESVNALVRRPLTTQHAKLRVIVGNIADTSLLAGQQFDDVFCCLGTTINVAGSKEAFRRVDYDLPIGLAAWAKANGVQHFLLVSSMNASHTSAIFYSRVKGELEQALMAMAFPALTIVRPSLLDAEREESRFGEELGLKLARFTAPVLERLLPNYAAVKVEKVAATMILSAETPLQGVRFISSGQIQRTSIE